MLCVFRSKTAKGQHPSEKEIIHDPTPKMASSPCKSQVTARKVQYMDLIDLSCHLLFDMCVLICSTDPSRLFGLTGRDWFLELILDLLLLVKHSPGPAHAIIKDLLFVHIWF